MLRPEILTCATDWPSLASAHRNWEGVPPKKFNRENLKFGLKFSVLGSITSGLQGVSSRNFFSVDVPRCRSDKLSTIFLRPDPKNLGGPKNRPKFWTISHNFRLWPRISPERIHISKIGKVVYQLPPLPRWVKKSWCTLVHKRKRYWA